MGSLASPPPGSPPRRGFWGAIYIGAVIPSILLSFGFWISWLDADVGHTRDQVSRAVTQVEGATTRAGRDLQALADGAESDIAPLVGELYRAYACL